MKKILFTLTLLITLSSFGQLKLKPNPFLKGQIILKDGSIRNGGIRLNDSAFRIKFKDSVKQQKSEKIDFKTIEKIIINIDSLNSREFYYKKTTKNKFYSFVELLQSGNIDFYKDLSKNYNQFYAGIDRRTTKEWMDDNRSEDHEFPNIENPQTVTLNGETRTLSTHRGRTNQFLSIEIEIPKYFINKKNGEKLFFLDTKKDLKKIAIKYLSDCPSLVKKIEDKDLKKRDIVEIVEYYNKNCGKE